VTAQLHLAIHALALQLLLKRAESLVDIVVAYENLHKPTYLNQLLARAHPCGVTQESGNTKEAESVLIRLRVAARYQNRAPKASKVMLFPRLPPFPAPGSRSKGHGMNPSSSIQASVLVGAGGAIGAVLRYQAGRWIGTLSGPNAAFPWATFAINVAGSLAMGVLVGWLARHGGADSEAWRLLLAVGVLGGFTTFSSFSLETALLIQRGLVATAAIYASGSVLAGVGGLFLGLMIMRTPA
jgi:CrcB protein